MNTFKTFTVRYNQPIVYLSIYNITCQFLTAYSYDLWEDVYNNINTFRTSTLVEPYFGTLDPNMHEIRNHTENLAI